MKYIISKIQLSFEKHQCKKCEKCPCYWSDGMFSENGCYVDEGKCGDFLYNLQQKLGDCEYGGCLIPLPLIKAVSHFQWKREQRKFKKYQKDHPLPEYEDEIDNEN